MTPEEMNMAAREIIRQSRHVDPIYQDLDSSLSSPHSDSSPHYRWFPSSQHSDKERSHHTSGSAGRHGMVNVTSL